VLLRELLLIDAVDRLRYVIFGMNCRARDLDALQVRLFRGGVIGKRFIQIPV
jgi:hypothetical protein